jgi:hypothetical protein
MDPLAFDSGNEDGSGGENPLKFNVFIAKKRK